jgi:hypothetical protein
MKSSGLFILFILFSLWVSAQRKDTTVIVDNKVVKVIKDNDSTKVYIDNNQLENIEQGKDTTQIKIGRKIVTIIVTPEGTLVKVGKDKEGKYSNFQIEKEGENYFDHNGREKSRDHFKGHWVGIELGMNNFVNNKFSMVRSGNDEFMDLNTGKSWNFNINFLQHSFGIISDKLGIVTGLGLEFNNYRFDNGNTIGKDSAGYIIEKDYASDVVVEKSKLATTFLTLPLLFELQSCDSHRKNRVHITAGVIFGLKLGSHTKVVYKVNGNEETDKVGNDFNINELRYGLTARVGYKSLNVFGNYYPTPLFERNKGPELHPVAVGLAWNF